MKESFDFAEHEESEGCVVTITIPSNSAVDESEARAAFEDLIEDGGGDGAKRGEAGEQSEQRRYGRNYNS